MACHTPPLKKAKKQGKCHSVPSLIIHSMNGMGLRTGNPTFCTFLRVASYPGLLKRLGTRLS